jgi:hypothetical protein
VAAELEPEQRQLLAEWLRPSVTCRGGPDRQRKIIAADLDELVYAGYLRVDVHHNYTISPEGRAFYAEMQRQAGEPAQRADAEVRRYLDGDDR